MKGFHLALALIALLATDAQSATVMFSLYKNVNADRVPTPGSFIVTAVVCGCNNGGLSGYGLDLTGAITSLNHLSPRDSSAVQGSHEGPAGFTLGRSPDNVNFVVASQDIGNPDAIMIYGFGKEESSFQQKGIDVGGSTLEQPSWNRELLLAVGTYSGSASSLGINFNGPNFGARIFDSDNGTVTRVPEVIAFPTLEGLCPEPHALSMAGLSCIAMILTKRRCEATTPSGNSAGKFSNYSPKKNAETTSGMRGIGTVNCWRL